MKASRRDPVLSLFPLPALLRMDAGGLEISEHSIKYLSFTSGGKFSRIKEYGNKDIPQGIVIGGEIKDIAGLADILRGLLKEIKNPRVHVSLPEQKGYIFRMNVPRSAELSLREAVEFRLVEYVPLAPSDVVFDAEIIESESTDAEYILNVTAFPRSTVEGYYDALTIGGYTPLTFEIESQAAARSVIPLRDAGVHMIVDFGETRTAIAVVQAGIVRFTTSLELAGGSLGAALKKAGVMDAEIENTKNDVGIVGGRGEKADGVLAPIVAQLRTEIQRHFVYWHTHGESVGAKHGSIGSVILCGGNSNLRGLPEYLSAALRVPVTAASVWQNAFPLSSYVPAIPLNQSLRYATVAGLALRCGIQSS